MIKQNNQTPFYFSQARSQQQEITERHQAEMGGMKTEISALTSDLHERDNTIGLLSNRLPAAEEQLRNAQHKNDRYAEELQVILNSFITFCFKLIDIFFSKCPIINLTLFVSFQGLEAL